MNLNKLIKNNVMIIFLISIFIISSTLITVLFIQNRESEEISRLFITILAPQLAVLIGIFAILKDINIKAEIPIEFYYHSKTFTPFELIEFSKRIQEKSEPLTIPSTIRLNLGIYTQEFQKNQWIPTTIKDPIIDSREMYHQILLRKIVDDLVFSTHMNWNDINNTKSNTQEIPRKELDKYFAGIKIFDILLEGPSKFRLPKNTTIDVIRDDSFRICKIMFENNYAELEINLRYTMSSSGLGKLGILYGISNDESQENYITSGYTILINGKLKKYRSFHPNAKLYRSWIEKTINYFKQYDSKNLFKLEKEIEFIKGISKMKDVSKQLENVLNTKK